jgi:hypothetical protein
MSNRFARPTPATLDRCRSERAALLRAARATYDAHGDAAVTLELLGQARERQRKVRWARKVLGPTATMPSDSLGTPGGRP